jgi:hypothetical protein
VEEFLEVLLKVLKIVFFFEDDYRKNIAEFK